MADSSGLGQSLFQGQPLKEEFYGLEYRRFQLMSYLGEGIAGFLANRSCAHLDLIRIFAHPWSIRIA
jgi:hypothetical protein